MRYVLVGLALVSGSVLAEAVAPDYCTGFSGEACARIKAVLDTHVRPDYCAPGFGRTDNPNKLTDEQLRICYAQPLPPMPPAMQRSVEAHQQQMNQRIADARAQVKNQWAGDTTQLEDIELAYKCGVADEISASVAVRRVQVRMRDELNQAGLAGDPTMDIQGATTPALQAGKRVAEAGGCAELTGAQRGQLRALIAGLGG
jgi:hypothetical protein